MKLSSPEALDFLLGAKAAGFSLTLLTAASYALEIRHRPVVVLGIAGGKNTNAAMGSCREERSEYVRALMK